MIASLVRACIAAILSGYCRRRPTTFPPFSIYSLMLPTQNQEAKGRSSLLTRRHSTPKALRRQTMRMHTSNFSPCSLLGFFIAITTVILPSTTLAGYACSPSPNHVTGSIVPADCRRAVDSLASLPNQEQSRDWSATIYLDPTCFQWQTCRVQLFPFDGTKVAFAKPKDVIRAVDNVASSCMAAGSEAVGSVRAKKGVTVRIMPPEYHPDIVVAPSNGTA